MKKIFLALALIASLLMAGCFVAPGDEGEDEPITTPTDDDVGEPLPQSSGVNDISGKTYYIGSDITVFSVTASGASSGTYTVKKRAEDDSYQDILDEDDKYTYHDTETGTYAWNNGTKTITLKPARITYSTLGTGPYTLLDKAGYRSQAQAIIDNWGFTEEQLKTALQNLGFSSLSEYINDAANKAFSNKANSYSLSSDETALFLIKQLPANTGTNELSGQTYYGMNYNSGSFAKDNNATYIFTASGYTSREGRYYGQYETTVGSYSYDSTSKKVWFKPSTIEGKDIDAFYTEMFPAYSHHFVDDDAYRASETNEAFNYRPEGTYDITAKTIRR